MANLYSTPSNHSARVLYDPNGINMKSNGIKFLAAPRDKDGALIDLTGYTTGNMGISHSGAVPFSGDSLPVALASGGATGVEVTVADDDAAGIFENFTGPVQFCLQITNTTNWVIAAIGTITGQEVRLEYAI